MNYLYLNDNKLNGLGSDIFNLIPPSVIGLELSQNRFSGTVPFGCMGFKSQNLYLRQNYFSGSIPDEVPLLTELSKLDIGGNMMTGTLPTSLHTVGVVFVLLLS
jgi:Leucine-rich repeat (LRR) protein